VDRSQNAQTCSNNTANGRGDTIKFTAASSAVNPCFGTARRSPSKALAPSASASWIWPAQGRRVAGMTFFLLFAFLFCHSRGSGNPCIRLARGRYSGRVCGGLRGMELATALG